MKVKKLSVNNFRGIHHMEIELQPDINILVGENGAGKSSLIDLLAILLSKLIGRIQSSQGTGRFFSEYDIKIGFTETYNTIVVEFMSEQVEWEVTKTRKGIKKQRITNLSEIKNIVSKIESLFVEDEDASFPVVVLYSVNRAVLNVPLRIKTRHDFYQLAAYDQALSSQGRNDFRLFFEWFRKREDLENESARYRMDKTRPRGWEFPDRQLEAVRQAIANLMPGYGSLKVRRSPLRMTLEKHGNEFRIDQLSDGEKCLIAMVGDMARRLAIANPALKNPLEVEGVFLIDEIDLHLHPAWQRKVIPRLTETFPNCQFIVSTHSPLVISHVEAESVFLLTVTEDNIEWSKPESSYGMEASSILEDVMNVPSRPKEVKDEFNKIFVAIDEGDLDKARNLINKLKENIPFDYDLVKAEMLMKRKERIGK